MDALKSLPREYAEVIALKILLTLFLVFTVGFLLVTALATVLYIYQFSLPTILISCWGIWILYILIFALLYLIKNNEVKSKLQFLFSLANKEIFMNLGLFVINNVLKLAHKFHSRPRESD